MFHSNEMNTPMLPLQAFTAMITYLLASSTTCLSPDIIHLSKYQILVYDAEYHLFLFSFRYSGSAAAMSMVGHILGLGDRHLDPLVEWTCGLRLDLSTLALGPVINSLAVSLTIYIKENKL